jgi:hypothetical protein
MKQVAGPSVPVIVKTNLAGFTRLASPFLPDPPTFPGTKSLRIATCRSTQAPLSAPERGRGRGYPWGERLPQPRRILYLMETASIAGLLAMATIWSSHHCLEEVHVAYRLIERGRRREKETARLVVKDYDREPQLCRRGLWWGIRREYEERVVLSFEHAPDDLAVGWRINDADYFGHPGTRPAGDPIPSAPGFRAVTPYEGRYHRLALICGPGTEGQCLWVQPVYTTIDPVSGELKDGPRRAVCLSGYEMQWASHLLREEAQCIARFSGLVDERYNFRIPIGQWAGFLDGPAGPLVTRLQGAIDVLDRLDGEADRDIIAAVRTEVESIVERLRYHAVMVRQSTDQRSDEEESTAQETDADESTAI